jgi:hypothetical protein
MARAIFARTDFNPIDWWTSMKRCVCGLLCALVLLSGSNALADAPNPRQSVTYFMAFFNECVVQAANIAEQMEKAKKEKGYPFTPSYLFYFDLMGRLEKALTLTLNLCDIYHLYSKTTYCFTKDEKTYIFDRIDNIVKVLEQLGERSYVVDIAAQGPAKDKMIENRDLFAGRVRKLREFIKVSLPGFQR